jgi:hypothetical protein
MIRWSVSIAFCVVCRADVGNWLVFVPKMSGTTRMRSAPDRLSKIFVTGLEVPGKFVNVTFPITGVALELALAE